MKARVTGNEVCAVAGCEEEAIDDQATVTALFVETEIVTRLCPAHMAFVRAGSLDGVSFTAARAWPPDDDESLVRFLLDVDDSDDTPTGVEWPDVTDEIRAAAALIDLLYEIEIAGGPLHIYTDDFNVEDSNLLFCQGQVDAEEDPETKARAQAILDATQPMTKTQRLMVMAVVEGWIV